MVDIFFKTQADAALYAKQKAQELGVSVRLISSNDEWVVTYDDKVTLAARNSTDSPPYILKDKAQREAEWWDIQRKIQQKEMMVENEQREIRLKITQDELKIENEHKEKMRDIGGIKPFHKNGVFICSRCLNPPNYCTCRKF